jgi:hypothetical protein
MQMLILSGGPSIWISYLMREAQLACSLQVMVMMLYFVDWFYREANANIILGPTSEFPILCGGQASMWPPKGFADLRGF